MCTGIACDEEGGRKVNMWGKNEGERDRITSPTELNYSTDMESLPNFRLLKREQSFLVQLRINVVLKQGPMVQTPLKELLQSIADDNEESWKLAGGKTKWADTTAKQIRTMLRHVDQGLLKSKGKPTPDWLKAYVEAEAEVGRRVNLCFGWAGPDV
eukprot:8426948-Pyramimonas_sp.AAC.1